MERTPNPSPRLHRLSAFAAMAVLAAATAAAFSRVFAGGSAGGKILVAAVASAVVASALERRNLLLATVVSAGLMLVAAGLFVLRWTTWHGLPTATTLRVIRAAASLVGRQANIQVAPTPPLRPLMLAALMAIWAAVFCAHALAFRAGNPLLALLPPVMLVAFADTVLQESFRPGYGVLFLIGALAVVLVDGLRRVQQWGPVWTFGVRRRAISGSTVGRAWRVSGSVIVVAALAPLFLPGLGGRALIDISGPPGSNAIRIDPQVEIASRLTSHNQQALFTVKTTTPTYYRMLGLDEFDGNAWTVDLNAGTRRASDAPLLVNAAGTATVEQNFSILADLVLPGLPAAYPPVKVSIPAATLRYDATMQNIYAGALEAGTTFSAVSAVVRPTPVELNSVRLVPGQTEERWVRLPSNLPAQIRALAEAWTAKSPTMYGKVLALQDHLSPAFGFRYDQSVDHSDSQYTLLDFLTTSKRGFCQQFSSAMAVLLRSIGIPARVAVGFTQGTYDRASGTTTITSSDAHSWVEVWFGDQYGWLAFEPTPRRENPIASGYDDPSRAACALSGRSCSAPGAGVQAPAVGRGPSRTAGLGRSIAERQGLFANSSGRLTARSRAPSPRILVLQGLAIVLVGLLLIPPLRALMRRIRLRRAAGDPRRLILATYDVFTDQAAEIGLGRRPGETVDEHRRKITTLENSPNGDPEHLGRLTTLVSRAAYALPDPSAAEAHEAARAAQGAIRELRRGVGPTRRLVGAWRPDRQVRSPSWSERPPREALERTAPGPRGTA